MASLFRTILDPLGITSGNEFGVLSGLDPAGVFTDGGLAGGESILGDTGSQIADPLGLFQKAGVSGPSGELSQSAAQNIALQEAQLRKIEEITAPFRQAALNQALPSLSALALGGESGFTPSDLFQRSLDRGREGILEQQAAGGPGIKSSRTFERLADLVQGLAAEDVERFEQSQRTLLEPGIAATQQLGSAASGLSGNVSGIFGALGQQLGQQALQSGQIAAQQQLARGQTLQSGLQGLGQLALAFG